jgi:hypothetical protein
MPNPTAHEAAVQELLTQVRGLLPSWQNPQVFFERRSDVLDGLRRLLHTPAPAPAPARPRGSALTLPLAGTPVAPPSQPPQPIVVTLSTERFQRLLHLVTAPVTRRDAYSFQGRIARWCAQIDERTHTITLDPDAIRWIRRQVERQQFGSYQLAVAKVFEGVHASFSGLVIQVRQRKTLAKRRRISK